MRGTITVGRSGERPGGGQEQGLPTGLPKQEAGCRGGTDETRPHGAGRISKRPRALSGHHACTLHAATRLPLISSKCENEDKKQDRKSFLYSVFLLGRPVASIERTFNAQAQALFL